jgi:hypothetical protein
MEIKDHPDSSRKALVSLQHIYEPDFLNQVVPQNRVAVNFYAPVGQIREAELGLITEVQPHPIVFTKRQLRWLGKRLIPENTRLKVHSMENIRQLDAMSATIKEYLDAPRNN